MQIEEKVFDDLLIPRKILESVGIPGRVQIIMKGGRIKDSAISTKNDSEGDERAGKKYSTRKKFSRTREGAKSRMEDVRIIGLDTNIFMNVLREESGTESSAILLEQIESGNKTVIGL